ncbi:retrovirus-related pol polyprotein from transposon TNT 1-94 [Tanacetum coccineum]
MLPPSGRIVLNKGSRSETKGNCLITNLEQDPSRSGKQKANFPDNRKKLTLGKLDCGSQWRPTGKKFALGEMCHLTKLSVTCRTGIALGFGMITRSYIMGYGDYVIGDSVISKVYYMEGLGHNLFSVGQFCDSDLKSGLRKHTFFSDMLDVQSFQVQIMVMALSFKPFRGLPRLKFEKDHLCSACQLGKSKKFSHRPKSENTNMEVLHTLHMDLCGPNEKSQSIKGKKYILVIVDDYSRFTWVKFLRSKDETPEFVTNFLKQIQVGLNKTVRFIRTDNGTEFVNQVMSKYYEGVGIFHQKSVPRTPQQNGVVERRNRTLVESPYNDDLLESSHVSMGRSCSPACLLHRTDQLLITRQNENKPYELVHDKKPDLTFSPSICALCLSYNDSEKSMKIYKPKLSFGIFVDYGSNTQQFMTRAYHDDPGTTQIKGIRSTPTTKRWRFNTQVVPPGTSLSTTIAQDAPSTSASSSTSDMHHPVRHQGIAEEPTLEDSPITHDVLHPSFNPVTGEPGSAQSSSGNVNSAEPNQVNQPPDHLRR